MLSDAQSYYMDMHTSGPCVSIHNAIELIVHNMRLILVHYAFSFLQRQNAVHPGRWQRTMVACFLLEHHKHGHSTIARPVASSRSRMCGPYVWGNVSDEYSCRAERVGWSLWCVLLSLKFTSAFETLRTHRAIAIHESGPPKYFYELSVKIRVKNDGC